jgi:hypothetical protein
LVCTEYGNDTSGAVPISNWQGWSSLTRSPTRKVGKTPWQCRQVQDLKGNLS